MREKDRAMIFRHRIRNLPFFYGWVVVIIVWVLFSLSWAIRGSFSLFFVALIEEFHWTRALVGGINTIFILVMGGSAPLIGMFMDRFRPHYVMATGVMLLAGSFFMCSRINSAWQFYVFYGLVAGVGANFTTMIFLGPFLSKWFHRRLGTAIGLVASGGGIGLFIFLPLLQFIIQYWGWRAAYLFLCIVLAGFMVPLIVAFLGVPGDLDLLPDGDRGIEQDSEVERKAGERFDATRRGWTVREALRSRELWLLLTASFCTTYCLHSVFTHGIPNLIDAGITRMSAASAFGLVGILGSLCNAFFGYLSDRIGRSHSFSLGTVSGIAGTILLMVFSRESSTTALYVFAILFSAGYGSRLPIIPALAADLFKGKNIGLLYGIISTGTGLGGLGPWLGGLIHDHTGSYKLLWVSVVGFFLLGDICVRLSDRRRAPGPDSQPF